MARRYTSEEVDRIRQWASEGKEARFIAAQLGRGIQPIYSIASKHGIKLGSPEKYCAGAKRAVLRRDRKAHAEACSRAWTPERRAQLSILAKQRIADGCFAQSWSGERRGTSRLAWCPVEKLELYQQLRKRFGAGSAKRMVLAEVAREMRAQAPRTRLTFEQQLERARNGAQIIELRRPTADATMGHRSLIGCSAALAC